MGLKPRLFSAATDTDLEKLGVALYQQHPFAARVEEEVYLAFHASGLTKGIADSGMGARYYRFYTIPVLDGLGLLGSEGSVREAAFWGSVQLSLGLHIRFMDYLLDRDDVDLGGGAVAERAAAFLRFAQERIAERQLSWGDDQWRVYRQYFGFHDEVGDGYVHGGRSLWRRVSPLCVVPETYLRGRLGAAFDVQWHRYLAWCLLLGDYHHWSVDYRAGRSSAVTDLLRRDGGRASGASENSVAEMRAHFRSVLSRDHAALMSAVESAGWLRWRACLEVLGSDFRADGSDSRGRDSASRAGIPSLGDR